MCGCFSVVRVELFRLMVFLLKPGILILNLYSSLFNCFQSMKSYGNKFKIKLKGMVFSVEFLFHNINKFTLLCLFCFIDLDAQTVTHYLQK